MAKFSVNSVEVVSDAGMIDWTKVNGATAIALNATKRTTGTGEFFTYSLEDDGTGKVRLVETRYNCDDIADCACACLCLCGE